MDGDAYDPKLFMERFTKSLTEIDDIANITLRGHLLVESDLNDVIRIIFFHPERIVQFGFERKVQIARAMARTISQRHDWDLLLALNALRNEVAHKHPGEGRQKKIDRVRRTYLTVILQKWRPEHSRFSDRDIIVRACALCSGFLCHYEADLQNLRWHIQQFAIEDASSSINSLSVNNQGHET